MHSSEYVLELYNVFYSGEVEPSSCLHRLMGHMQNGIILKDVSMKVHSGEVMAILGSKGSGKKALLDVISHRVQGPTRGQILLNNQPMTKSLFQQNGAYFTHKCDLIPGLTVEQTLMYTPTKVSGYQKKTKVKQILADLALSQVGNRCIENLTKSEYRRLVIGVQLIKDPVILLLNEPTWNLDPLNTYLVVSILSNIAKKYGTAIILTMEKPRSDVFPFLERVLYLSLGDVVYTGGTREMLDYFNSISFPCPKLENPLMYYLCLSTVDRRSRERFIESNHQIALLVEQYKKERLNLNSLMNERPMSEYNVKFPVLSGKKSNFIQTFWILFMRTMSSIINFKKTGMRQIFLRLFLVPIYFLLLWVFYKNVQGNSHLLTRNGLILNSLIGTYFLGIINCAILYPKYRTRYFQENQEGLYGSTIFLVTYNLTSFLFSFISFLIASSILYPLIGSYSDGFNFIYFTLTLWTCYIFAEQQTIALLMMIKNNLTAAIASFYITCVCMSFSGLLRSYKGLQDWLYYISFATQSRYAAAFLNKIIFFKNLIVENDLPNNCLNNIKNNLKTTQILNNSLSSNQCKFTNEISYLTERYSRDNNFELNDTLDGNKNLYFVLIFSLGIILFNLFLYVIPVPKFVRNKFCE